MPLHPFLGDRVSAGQRDRVDVRGEVRVADHVDDGPADARRVDGHRWPLGEPLHEVVEPSDDRRVRRVPKALEIPDVVGFRLPLLEDRDGCVVRRLAEVDADDESHCSTLGDRLDVVEEDVARRKGQRLERRSVREERRDVVREGPLDVDRPEELVRRVRERALVLLLVPPLTEGCALFLEELRRDPRALPGRDLDAVPRAVARSTLRKRIHASRTAS